MSEHSQHEQHHHGGPLIYTANLVCLLILTGVTIGASYINFGTANIAIALAIATCKAILVAMIFMHLKWDKSVNAIIALAGFLFLGVFITFDLIDLDNRRDPLPRAVPAMAKPTPVPETMNPLKTPTPVPAYAAPKAEGEHE